MKTFNEIRAPKIKKGLRDKKGKLHTVDMKLDGSKLSFRVTDEFGSFKTVNAKGLAKMFEGTDVDKFIEEARGYGKKPVSMMTPAEKKKDAERRKEYKAYQKSKREDVEEGAFYGRDDLVKQFKPTKAQKKLNVRLVRNKRGGMERATLNIKKDAKKIAQLKKDGYKVDPTYYTEVKEQNCGCGKTPCETYGNVDEAMNPKDKAKRLKLIKKAVERINKNNAEKAKKDALRMMKDSGMFDESVEITEAKQSYVDQMRDIVAKKSAKKINGVMVDMFTASAVVKVYDAINDTNKAKMDKMTVPAMANVAFKLLKK